MLIEKSRYSYLKMLIQAESEKGIEKMSLLWMEYEAEFEHLVEASFARESREGSIFSLCK